MWFTAVDIASTPGGQAGMQRSQPLQWSTSMVTVPRLFTSRVSETLALGLGMGCAPFPCGMTVGGQQVPPGEDGALVRLDVLRSVWRDRLAHRLHERRLLD